jgi:hypothetical protein
MSSSPADGDPPPDDDALVRTCGDGDGDGDAALLARDRLFVVAVPMLADLDVRELAGDTMPPSASSSPGGRESKLRARRVPRAAVPAEVSSIHRVALKESRNRTFLIASRSVPRIDDDRFLPLPFDASFSSSVDDGRTPETAMEQSWLTIGLLLTLAPSRKRTAEV